MSCWEAAAVQPEQTGVRTPNTERDEHISMTQRKQGAARGLPWAVLATAGLLLTAVVVVIPFPAEVTGQIQYTITSGHTEGIAATRWRVPPHRQHPHCLGARPTGPRPPSKRPPAVRTPACPPVPDPGG